MKKSETVTIRLSKEYKDVLTNICSEHGVKPGTYAAAAVESWLDACQKSGGYIKPAYQAGDLKTPLKETLPTIIEAWGKSDCPDSLEIEAAPDGERIILHRRPAHYKTTDLKAAEASPTYGNQKESTG